MPVPRAKVTDPALAAILQRRRLLSEPQEESKFEVGPMATTTSTDGVRKRQMLHN